MIQALGFTIGALIIRIGFGGILHYSYNKATVLAGRSRRGRGFRVPGFRALVLRAALLLSPMLLFLSPVTFFLRCFFCHSTFA